MVRDLFVKTAQLKADSCTRPLGRVPSPILECVWLVYIGGKMPLAGANGLRSASGASAKQTMSGGRCSGGVSDCGVEEHRVIVI